MMLLIYIPTTWIDWIILLLLALIIISAVLSVEHPNLVYAVLFLLVVNVLLSIIYYLMGAPFVAFFQIFIYAGAIIVFFLITIMLTHGGKWEWRKA